jgi:hypothetical protein
VSPRKAREGEGDACRPSPPPHLSMRHTSPLPNCSPQPSLVNHRSNAGHAECAQTRRLRTERNRVVETVTCLSLSRSLSHTHTRSFPLTNTFTHALSLSHAHTHSPFFSLSHTQALVEAEAPHRALGAESSCLRTRAVEKVSRLSPACVSCASPVRLPCVSRASPAHVSRRTHLRASADAKASQRAQPRCREGVAPLYRGTSLIRNTPPMRPYSSISPEPYGGRRGRGCCL